MRVNIFEGARRILRLIQALWVLGAFVVAFIDTPYVGADYYTTGPNQPFVRAPAGFQCGALSATEHEYRTTAGGTNVSADLCFQASSYPNNRTLVPFIVADDGAMLGNDYFSNEVTTYTRQRARDFKLPAAHFADFDKQRWNARLGNLKTALYAAVIGVVVLSVLALIIGWIVRGFAGIPMRSDTRPREP